MNYLNRLLNKRRNLGYKMLRNNPDSRSKILQRRSAQTHQRITRTALILAVVLKSSLLTRKMEPIPLSEEII